MNRWGRAAFGDVQLCVISMTYCRLEARQHGGATSGQVCFCYHICPVRISLESSGCLVTQVHQAGDFGVVAWKSSHPSRY